MTSYILRRLVVMVPVAFLASVMLFLLLKLTPGDPVLIMLGEKATAQNYEALRHELGLDQPYPVQYVAWLGHIVQGDFGKSLRNGAPVKGEIQARLPATLQLGATALLLSVVIAFPLGHPVGRVSSFAARLPGRGIQPGRRRRASIFHRSRLDLRVRADGPLVSTRELHGVHR